MVLACYDLIRIPASGIDHIIAVSSNLEAHIEETLWTSLVKMGHTTKTMLMILLSAYADDQVKLDDKSN